MQKLTPSGSGIEEEKVSNHDVFFIQKNYHCVVFVRNKMMKLVANSIHLRKKRMYRSRVFVRYGIVKLYTSYYSKVMLVIRLKTFTIKRK